MDPSRNRLFLPLLAAFPGALLAAMLTLHCVRLLVLSTLPAFVVGIIATLLLTDIVELSLISRS